MNHDLQAAVSVCLKDTLSFIRSAKALAELLQKSFPDLSIHGGPLFSPEAFLAQLRIQGITDPYELAARLDEVFPGQISDAKLGAMLPARPGTVISWAGRRSRGQRLRRKRK